MDDAPDLDDTEWQTNQETIDRLERELAQAREDGAYAEQEAAVWRARNDILERLVSALEAHLEDVQNDRNRAVLMGDEDHQSNLMCRALLERQTKAASDREFVRREMDSRERYVPDPGPWIPGRARDE